MATTVGVLSASIVLLTTGFDKGVNAVLSGFSRMGRAAIALNQSIELAGRLTTGFTGKLGTLGKSFIDTAANLEALKIGLDTTTKGEGDTWFAKLNEWAIKMPINTEAAIRSFQLLRAMGMKPAIGDMTTLIDTTSALGGSKDTLEGIARAIGQINTKGKVHLQELYQLAERGVPVFEILSKYTNLTKEQIADIGRYGVDAAPVIEVIMRALDDTFGGQSEKMMHSYKGLLEGLLGLWTEFQRVTMNSGPLGLIEKTLERVTQKIDFMRARGEFDQFAREVGFVMEEAIQWVVDLGETAWENRDNIVKFFESMGESAKEAWPAIRDTAKEVGRFSTAVFNLWQSLPEDLKSASGTGLIVRVLTGSNKLGGIAAALSLVNTELEKLKSENDGKPVAGLGGVKELFAHDLPLAYEATSKKVKELQKTIEDGLTPSVWKEEAAMDAMKESAKTAQNTTQAMTDQIEKGSESTYDFGQALKSIATLGNQAQGIKFVADNVKKMGLSFSETAAMFGVSEETLREAIINSMTNNTSWVTELENLNKTTDLTVDNFDILENAVSNFGKTTESALEPTRELAESLKSIDSDSLWYKASGIKPPNTITDIATAGARDRAGQLNAEMIEKIKGLRNQYYGLSKGLSDYQMKLLEIDASTQQLIIKHQKQIELLPELKRNIEAYGEAQKELFHAQTMNEWERQYKETFASLNSEITIMLQRIHNGFGDMWEEIERIAQEKANIEIDVQYKFSTDGFDKFTSSLQDRVQTVMDTLMKELGISAKKAAGITGSFMNENATLDPSLWQKGTPESSHVLGLGKAGFGIAQWTSSDRQEFLKNFAGEHINDLKTQVLAAIYELKTTEKGALDEILKAADDEKIVSRIFTTRFERPGVDHKDDAGAATKAYGMYRPGASQAPAASSTETISAMSQIQAMAKALRQSDIDTEESKKRLIVYLKTILDLEQQVKSAELTASQAGLSERDKLFSSIDDAQKKALKDIEATTQGLENMGWVTDSVIERFNKLKEAAVTEKANSIQLEIDDAKFQNSLIGLTDAEKIIAETNEKMRLWGSTTDEVAQKLRELGEIKLEGLSRQLKEQVKQATSLKTAFNDILEGWKGAFSDFFMTFAETGKLAFKDLGAALVKALQMTAAKLAAESLMLALSETVKALVATATGNGAEATMHWTAAAQAAAAAPMYLGFVAGSGLMAGMAHHGIDSVPEDGTWLLKKKERVVDAKTNQDLKQFLIENKDGNRPNVTIAPVFNNSDEEGVLRALPQLKQMIIDTVHGDIAGNGPIRHAVMNYT
jgi:tape measure domain-containing protein